MDDIIFSGSTQVDIQQIDLLQQISDSQTANSSNQVTYELAGFDSAIALVDARADHLDEAAHLTISMTETAVLQFTLTHSPDKRPTHMLWLATGDQTSTPPHKELFMQIAPLPNGRFAYLALCQMPSASH